MSEANQYPKPPFETQPQAQPGQTTAMTPQPDHGEQSYRGSGKLEGKVAIITGADSGIGRAVAIAFAREGADLVLSYLDEQEDADETARWVTKAGRKVTLIPGDISDANHASSLVTKAVEAHGHVDVIVNNAAYQNPVDSIDEITVEDWNKHFAVNVHSMFYIIKAAVLHHQSCGSTSQAGRINNQYGIHECQKTGRPTASLLRYEGGNHEPHCKSCAGVCGKRSESERRASRSDMDATHPVNHERQRGQHVR